MAKTTSTEFVEWNVHLERELNAFHREDYYLAQIAAEVRRGHSRHGVRIKDLILEFTTDSQEEDEPLSKEEATTRSKALFFGICGYTEEPE